MLRRVVTGLLLVAAAGALAGAVALRSRIGHPVTARMQQAADAMEGRPSPLGDRADPVAAVLVSDRSESPRPTLLVFIQDGCPCSEAAEPHFRELYAAYGDYVRFLGVIDGTSSTAQDWITRHQTPYPVIPDAEQVVIRAFGAERSAYSALVRPDGMIERLSPGYSREMLRDLGARMAMLSGIVAVPITADGAPESLTSGCSF